MIFYYLCCHPKGIPPTNHIQPNSDSPLANDTNTSEAQG
jgi:hypothetical protein